MLNGELRDLPEKVIFEPRHERGGGERQADWLHLCMRDNYAPWLHLPQAPPAGTLRARSLKTITLYPTPVTI